MKKEEISLLSEHSVPMSRATWFIKVRSGQYCDVGGVKCVAMCGWVWQGVAGCGWVGVKEVCQYVYVV